MFPPIFPIYIRELAPLNQVATLVWLSGLACLWLTRHTHRLAGRWGRAYYVLSALVRPVGVLLIAAGWLALYALPAAPFFGRQAGWLPRGNWLDVLFWLAVAAFFGLGLWAVAVLGLRRSFLYRRLDDPLIARGPYVLVRHPQFLSAIGIAISGWLLFRTPRDGYYAMEFYYHVGPNCTLLILALWLLAALEERELREHFGAAYEAYARRVPRLFPDGRTLVRALEGWPAAAPGLRALGAGLAKGEARLREGLPGLQGAVAALGSLGVVLSWLLLLGVAAYNVELRGGLGEWWLEGGWVERLNWLAVLGFLALGLWAIATLGLKRTVRGARAGEPLVGKGPYALLRHPQYLSAIGVLFFALRPLEALGHLFLFGELYDGGTYWLASVVALWLLALLEERELLARYGAEYEGYARRVAGLIPN